MRILLTICLLFFCASMQAQKDEAYKEIKQLIDAQDYKKAEKALKSAIKKSPENADYHVLNGRLYMLTSRGSESFQALSKAISINPTFAEAYYERSVLYYYLEDMGGCIQDANEAVKYATDDSLMQWIKLNRGACFGHMQRYDDALADFDWIIEKDSNNVGALNDKAMLLESLKQYDESIELLKRIIALEPDQFFGYMNLGFLLSNIERYEEAAPYFDKALELQPKHPFLLNNSGYCLFKLGRRKEAIDRIEQSLKVLPGNSYAYRNLALIAIAEGRIEDACENLNLALANNFSQMYGSEVKELKEKHCR